jgi:hypothetical protein
MGGFGFSGREPLVVRASGFLPSTSRCMVAVANVEFFVVVFFSFLVVLSLTAFTLAVIWRIRKNLSR